MNKYVTIDKRSKKAQKKYYAMQRITWGDFCPATREIPNGKIYRRNRDKRIQDSI